MAETREVARFMPSRIPYHPLVQERFGVDQAGWRALVDAVWPGARTADAIVLALSYCKARKLDPFKRPVHIVGIYSRELKRVVESVWPGIGELRTTAFRTGLYAGREATEWGPDRELSFDSQTLAYPEWAQVTVHRLDRHGNPRAYPGPRVYWLESYATRAHDTIAPNEMWRRRTRGQLDKCAEAAALRAAFPEELGNDYAAEEMEGQVVDHAPAEPTAPAAPPLRGNAALRSRLTPEPLPEPPPWDEPDEPEEDDSPAPDDPAQPSAPVQAATPGAEVTRPAATRHRRRAKPEEPSHDFTEEEIARSQEMIAAVLGPEEVARLDGDISVLVPFDAAGSVQEWFSRARERLREMQQARFSPDRFVAYRKANAGALMRLRAEFASYADQLDQIIAAGERGGAALGYVER
jgi:phage recombination protein Bet